MTQAARKSVEVRKEELEPEADALVEAIGRRARNLYETRQLLCTEAVVIALNAALRGGLSEAKAVAMAAPFCVALGESGCMCGALSGAVLASGLILGKHQPHRHRREIRESARQLHDAFKAANGSTCCRVISNGLRSDRKAHFRRCATLTAEAAEMAAGLILQKRPDLIREADSSFLGGRQSAVGGAVLRVFRYFFSRTWYS